VNHVRPRRDANGGGYPAIAMSGPPAVKNPHVTALLAALLVLCAGTLAACGGSKSSTTTSVASNPGASTSASAGSSTRTSAGSTTGGSTATGATGPAQSKKTRAGHAGTSTAGGSGATSTAAAPPAPSSPETSSVKRCLERNGIKPHSSGKAPTRAQLNAALTRCATPLAPRHSSQQTSAVRRRLLAQPSYRQALARFTSCMRTHGVPDFPEANTSGKGPLYPAGAVKPTPQVREAQKACIGALRVR